MSESDYQSRLDFAVDAARQAGALILNYYQHAQLAVQFKTDESPVTVADREAEELLRKQIGEQFPKDGVVGEEFPEKPAENGFRWFLDPIDGTKAFVAGVPLFGTLIGLEHDGRMVAGVVRFPALDEVVYARDGGGAWWQTGAAEPKPARVSSVDKLERALFCFTEMAGWYQIERVDVFERLCKSTRGARGWGDCYGHMLVATGRAEIAVDPLMGTWDIAALIPIVREAGGFCGAWNGEETIHAGQGVSTNAALKGAALALLKSVG